ncbi:MAG: glutathione binding-like protein, partial [Plesiomonas sp.]
QQEYVTGATFSIADAYMFTVLSWATPLKIDFAPYPHVQAYLARIGARPAVQQTLKAEGLI